MNKTKKKIKLSFMEKDMIRKTIEGNRFLGGSSWKEYTKDELIEIYGYFPNWAEKKTGELK